MEQNPIIEIGRHFLPPAGGACSFVGGGDFSHCWIMLTWQIRCMRLIMMRLSDVNPAVLLGSPNCPLPSPPRLPVMCHHSASHNKGTAGRREVGALPTLHYRPSSPSSGFFWKDSHPLWTVIWHHCVPPPELPHPKFLLVSLISHKHLRNGAGVRKKSRLPHPKWSKASSHS